MRLLHRPKEGEEVDGELPVREGKHVAYMRITLLMQAHIHRHRHTSTHMNLHTHMCTHTPAGCTMADITNPPQSPSPGAQTQPQKPPHSLPVTSTTCPDGRGERKLSSFISNNANHAVLLQNNVSNSIARTHQCLSKHTYFFFHESFSGCHVL